jgi:hypothetical protein
MSRWVIASRCRTTPEASKEAAMRTESAFRVLSQRHGRILGLNKGEQFGDYFVAVIELGEDDLECAVPH